MFQKISMRSSPNVLPAKDEPDHPLRRPGAQNGAKNEITEKGEKMEGWTQALQRSDVEVDETLAAKNIGLYD